jgi:pSer/pThr/pTyr-binding forkhead associated (FHA) protein
VAGSEFWIPEGIYVVGRDSLSPRDAHISRQHLAVACLNGSLHVQDAGSANKTYVGGQLAEQPTAVSSGSEIRIAGNAAVYTRT